KHDEPLLVDVDRVNVLFTVATKKGKVIAHLKRDDFKVFENDELQTVTNFSSESNLPLNIALLIDTSGSVRHKLRFEREAATDLFESVIRPGTDSALVIGFDTAVNLLQPFTDTPAKLIRAVNDTIAGGSTSLYDAVYKAVGELACSKGRRVIVLVSD